MQFNNVATNYLNKKSMIMRDPQQHDNHDNLITMAIF